MTTIQKATTRRRLVQAAGMFALAVPFAAAYRVPRALAVSEQEVLVDRAHLSVTSMLTDPQFERLDDYIAAARGVLIVPALFRGGFFIGGVGGSGIMLMRQQSGEWSYPAFFDVAGGSLGLQFGGQVSEMVLTVMTDKGLNAILNGEVTIGTDLQAAVGPVGHGIEARTGFATNADMYAFSSNAGLFIGGALQGTLIYEDTDWESAFYGPGATARAIQQGQYTNSRAEALRQALPR